MKLSRLEKMRGLFGNKLVDSAHLYFKLEGATKENIEFIEGCFSNHKNVVNACNRGYFKLIKFAFETNLLLKESVEYLIRNYPEKII